MELYNPTEKSETEAVKDVQAILVQSLSEAPNGVERYLTFYNQRRPHTALDNSTPDAF